MPKRESSDAQNAWKLQFYRDQSRSMNVTKNAVAFARNEKTQTDTLRERVIAQYHELLQRDETLLPGVFEKLHDTMRRNRLTYADRPISGALRPHLLGRQEFAEHTRTAELIASALEKVAAAGVQSRGLMTQLGLTDAEQNVAIIDPGFRGAAVTTRLDGFVH